MAYIILKDYDAQIRGQRGRIYKLMSDPSIVCKLSKEASDKGIDFLDMYNQYTERVIAENNVYKYIGGSMSKDKFTGRTGNTVKGLAELHKFGKVAEKEILESYMPTK